MCLCWNSPEGRVFMNIIIIDKIKSYWGIQEDCKLRDLVVKDGMRCTVVGRSLFSPEETGALGNGVEYWRGFYQSLRPTQFELSLNIDILARPFYKPVLASEFVDQYFDYPILDGVLGDIGYSEVTKALKGLKIALTYRDNKAYRMTGFSTKLLRQLTFTLKDKKTRTSVVQYYQERYNIVLKDVGLPALQVGSNLEPIYLPMELCSIVVGQSYSRNLNDRQVIELLRATCQRPQEREFNVMQMLRKNNSTKGGFMDEVFGMQVREEMALVHARVLPPPLLKYHGLVPK
ncbi:hypothetical protein Pyn_35602 [Prunus yedoensis var. nudiflora]|uniref:PAZ domain-containing protein n=1 Tax=Prunus yedoensis var. nudiflora TaxID=2094558 RepID=A0A314XNH6_PRUYE|nr:hypothetical protein Pyn_35602 [Prunus yedoensis var. nudiflora]